MGFLKNLFSGGAGQLVKSVGNVLDKVVTTKEEKMALENEIKKAEMQYQIDMRKLSIEERQIVLADTDSARKRESTIQTSQYGTKLGKNVSSYLALGTTLLAFSMFYVVIFKNHELETSGSKEIVLYILGVLSAIVTQIFSYYFGSSQGSAVKSDMMQKMQYQQK